MKAATQLRFAHPYILIFAAFCSLAAACMSATTLACVLWLINRDQQQQHLYEQWRMNAEKRFDALDELSRIRVD